MAVQPDASIRDQPNLEELPSPVVACTLASIDLDDLFIEEDDFSDMVRKLKREKNLILQGGNAR